MIVGEARLVASIDDRFVPGSVKPSLDLCTEQEVFLFDGFCGVGSNDIEGRFQRPLLGFGQKLKVDRVSA